MFLAMLAEGLLRVGRLGDGLKAIDEGFEYAEKIAEGGYVAELHRMRGELLRAAGEMDKAEESLRAAMAYAAGQQAKSFELRAATGLACLLRATGRRDEAGPVLAPVYEWFTEGWSTSDLMAARTLLTEIG
jgi:predicted ATPase